MWREMGTFYTQESGATGVGNQLDMEVGLEKKMSQFLLQ